MSDKVCLKYVYVETIITLLISAINVIVILVNEQIVAAQAYRVNVYIVYVYFYFLGEMKVCKPAVHINRNHASLALCANLDSSAVYIIIISTLDFQV